MITYLHSKTKARWSASQKVWYVTDNRHYRQLFGIEPVIVRKEVLNKINIVNMSEFKRFQEQLKLKGYRKILPFANSRVIR